MFQCQLEPTLVNSCHCFSLGQSWSTCRFHLRWHQQPLDDVPAVLALTPVTTFTPFCWGSVTHRGLSAVSDVNVSHIRWGAGQVCISRHTFWFCAAAVALSLPQAGLQERLDLLLTGPQAVLRNKHSLGWIRMTNQCVRFSRCIRMCLHTGSLPMTCDSMFVRFWEENEASMLFR